jgi:hypothetical protein
MARPNIGFLFHSCIVGSPQLVTAPNLGSGNAKLSNI